MPRRGSRIAIEDFEFHGDVIVPADAVNGGAILHIIWK